MELRVDNSVSTSKNVTYQTSSMSLLRNSSKNCNPEDASSGGPQANSKTNDTGCFYSENGALGGTVLNEISLEESKRSGWWCLLIG